jgi:hypothetical protein
MVNHNSKRYVEECFMETDLNWAIIAPGYFMGMTFLIIPAFATSSKLNLMFMPGFNRKTPFSCLALQDLSEAVAGVIGRQSFKDAASGLLKVPTRGAREMHPEDGYGCGEDAAIL